MVGAVQGGSYGTSSFFVPWSHCSLQQQQWDLFTKCLKVPGFPSPSLAQWWQQQHQTWPQGGMQTFGSQDLRRAPTATGEGGATLRWCSIGRYLQVCGECSFLIFWFHSSPQRCIGFLLAVHESTSPPLSLLGLAMAAAVSAPEQNAVLWGLSSEYLQAAATQDMIAYGAPCEFSLWNNVSVWSLGSYPCKS